MLGQDLKYGRMEMENRQDCAWLELHERQQLIFVVRIRN